MIRLLVFDLDGTLVDSRHDLAEAANRLVCELGGRPLSVETVTGMVGEGVSRLVGRVLEASGVTSGLDGAVARFRDIYGGCLLARTRAYPGVDQTLAVLSRDWPLAVLTNKPEDASRAVLGGLGLAGWFRWIVGGDGPWPRKPAPDGLLHLARGAGVEPASTLLVGDSAIDHGTARNAGTAVCLARYGFGFATLPAGALDGSEWIIDAPAELIDRLRGRGH